MIIAKPKTAAGQAAVSAPTRTGSGGKNPAAALPLIETGSTAAKTLASTWSGSPLVVVAAPPGGGKTHMLCVTAAHLASPARAGLNVGVACQTRAQAADLASRLAAATEGADVPVALLGARDSRPPDGIHQRVGYFTQAADLAADKTSWAPKGGVLVSTTARFRYLDARWPLDVLAVDEAWQSTWAGWVEIANLAPQHLLVGDPGQIPPVVTGETSRWAARHDGPHRPAPDVLLNTRNDVVSLRLPSSRRLGPATVAAIQCLYPGLEFFSARPPLTYHDTTGTPRPEIEVVTVDSYGDVNDPTLADTLAASVTDLIGGTVASADGPRPVTDNDIGVVVSHRAQATAVAARLAGTAPGTLVDTAESWQGLERLVMVALHPLAGHSSESSFAQGLGRACVMLSRHQAHLRVVSTNRVPALLTRLAADHPASTEVTTQVTLASNIGIAA